MTDEAGAGPTGHERMKRIPPKDLRLHPKRMEFDPKKAYQKQQLAELGAISIVWNQLEAQIDYLGSHILFRSSPFRVVLEVNKTVGLSGKIALLRTAASQAKILDEPAKKCVDIAFRGVAEYRTYRNAVIHHHIYDYKKGIATFLMIMGSHIRY